MSEEFSWDVYRKIEKHLRHFDQLQQDRRERARLLDEIGIAVAAMTDLDVSASDVREKLRESTLEQLTELLRRLREAQQS